MFCAAAAFLPDARLWGVNHLAFYPWPVRLIALALMGASLLPPVTREVLRWTALLSKGLATRRILTATALSLAALVLFIVFDSSTQLLGDGLYVQNNVDRAAKVEAGTLAEVIADPDPNYPATEMLYLVAPRIAARALGAEPLDVLRVMIAIFGAILVFAVCAAYREPRALPGPRPGAGPETDPTPLVLLVFLSGAVQIFFGYVETYAPVLCLSGLFVLSARRVIARGAPLWAPLVLALAATAMHLLGLLLLPALGALALWVAAGRRAARAFQLGSLGLAGAVIVSSIVAASAGPLEKFILPLAGGEYAVFSADHLADVLNEILLILPGAFVLGILVLMAGPERWRTWWRNDAAAASTGGESGVFAATIVFGLLLALPAVLFLLLFRPALGMARDWDLFAVAAVGLWTPLFAVLDRARSDAAARRWVDAALVPVLVMTAVLTAGWIGVNANDGRAVARFESILTYDRTNAGYAFETLASHHHDREDMASEIRALERAVESSRNPRYLFTLGLRYYYVGEKQKAARTLETCLKIKPDHKQARQSLIQMLFFMEENRKMLALARESAVLFPREPYYPMFEGMALLRLGGVREGREALERALGLDPSPDVRIEIEQIIASLPPDSGAAPDEAAKEQAK